MTSDHTVRRRWAFTGVTLALVGSLGLIAFPFISQLSFVSEQVIFPAVFALAIVMGVGAVVAVFNLRQS
ncbi:MAG TPA: hypothetical protein PLP66_14800 [Phycisphaerae bacterium]|mgnify:FL=1|jgi:CHASE2 domain-containing sensor protein|nr:hypothetical protein [Phycisphaerae bacterium]HPM25174.1 hypothetical protein [Phycisphaerae bacterium]